MKKCLKKNFNCIDVGCHKGEILDTILKYAPEGKHYAFEPIPFLYNQLKKKYVHKAFIFPYALSDSNGFSTFQLVKNALAYSGLKRRDYEIQNPDIEEIKVELKILDEIIPLDEKIDVVKIDVEGGEFDVIKGAKNLLRNNKPILLFEFGKGAGDFYGTNPLDLYSFINNEIDMKIFTLSSFIKKKLPLTKAEFEKCFHTNSEYYFVAAKNIDNV
jgi:FkbM family methyltransferase